MFEHVWAIFNAVSETRWSYGTQNEIQFSGVTSPKGDWHPPRTHQWPTHRQLTSNSSTTPSAAPAANRMDSLSPVRPPQPWPPYEPGRAIQKASKYRMLGIVKLGTFNHFSGCGYGAFIEPSGSSVLPLQQLGPQCSAQIPELHPTKANQWQVPSNQRAPIWKVPVRNQKPVLCQGLRQSCGTFNSTRSLLLGSPRLSETIRNNICWA